MSQSLCCICTNASKVRFNPLILCTSCLQESHSICYQQPANTPFFLCALCRMLLNDPFTELTDLIICPYLLPQKKQFEHYQKFELTFPQGNDLRNGHKRLFFFAMRLPRVEQQEDPQGNTKHEIISSKYYQPTIAWPPENVFFWVNNRPLDYDRKSYGEISIKLLRNSNEFSICCFEGLDDPVVFLMFLATKPHVSDLVQRISQRSLIKNCGSYRESFMTALRAQKSKLFKVIDVISGKRMVFPGRGRYCTHLACFDLENYLLVNESRGLEESLRWRCPICAQRTLWMELDLDLYVKDVLDCVEKNHREEGNYVFYDEFNYWHVQQREREDIDDTNTDRPVFYALKNRRIRPYFQEIEISKLKKNKRLFDAIQGLKTFYRANEVNGMAPCDAGFTDLQGLTDEEFFMILSSVGMLEGLYNEEPTNKLIVARKMLKSVKKGDFEDFYKGSFTGIIVNLSCLWARCTEQWFQICQRIMCRNRTIMPDVCLGVEFLSLAAWVIKSRGLEKKMGVGEKEKMGGILGTIMSHFVEKNGFDEVKVGKMLYLLWNNITELGFVEGFSENNYQERIEEMGDLLIQTTKSWTFDRFSSFLLRFYEPPRIIKDEDKQIPYFKIMIHYFKSVLKKKTANKISNPEVTEFMKKWDRNGVFEQSKKTN